MKFWHMAILGTLLMGLCFVHREARLKYQVGNQPAPNDGSWGYKFVTGVGNTAPSYEILNFVKAWNAEEGGTNTARFNPLNTTQPMPGATDFNSVHVKNYVSYEDGLAATITTVTNGRYARLLEGLRTNDVSLALAGLGEGVWGTNADNVSSIYETLPVPVSTQKRQMLQTTSAKRLALVQYALSLQGQHYTVGGGSAAFRAGQMGAGSGDCSSTMQHIYNHVLGIDIGTSTFSQFTNGYLRRGSFGNPNTVPISAAQLQPGDLWYGTYPDDEHTGMVVGDVTGDGTIDLIDQGGKKDYMGVNNDFLHDPYFMKHLVGFARILEN